MTRSVLRDLRDIDERVLEKAQTSLAEIGVKESRADGVGERRRSLTREISMNACSRKRRRASRSSVSKRVALTAWESH